MAHPCPPPATTSSGGRTCPLWRQGREEGTPPSAVSLREHSHTARRCCRPQEAAAGESAPHGQSRRDQNTKARGPVVTGCHPHWAPKPSVVGTESGFSIYLFSPPTWRLAPGTGSLGGLGVAGAPREGGRAELLGVHARVSPGASGPGSASTFPEGAERAGRVHWNGAGRPHRKCGNALLSEQEMDRAFFHPVPKS